MKLLDGIMRQPAAVAFGMRRGGSGSFTVARDGDSISLISGLGAATELPAASGPDAGVLSAADKAALDGLRTGQTAAAHFASRSEARAASIRSAVTALRTGGYAVADDGGGAAYIRVAAEPAHELKLQSADGAWWELLPEPGGLLPEQCGAAGDGTADDTAAFEAWRGYAIARLGGGVQGPEQLVTLRLRRGRHYTYANNRWAYGIPRLRVEGNGATLECVDTSALSANARALNQVSWFSDNGYAPVPGGVAYKNFGHLIATSLAGQAVVGFVTTADAANYAAGDTVLIGGLLNIAEDANPVDYRYFEVREVASVDAVGGTLTLTEALADSYYSTWPVLHTENGYDLGPARILKLNRAAHLLTRYFELNDVVLAPNRNQPTLARAVFDSALRIRLNRVDARGLILTSFSAAISVECQSCLFGEVEGDKLTDRVVLNDCEVTGGIGQFVGTQQLEINRGVIRGGAWKVAAKHQAVRGAWLDNVIYSAPEKVGLKLNYNEARRIESQVFEDLRVSDPSLQLVDAAHGDLFAAVTFNAVAPEGYTLPDGTQPVAVWDDINGVYLLDSGAGLASVTSADLMASPTDATAAVNALLAHPLILAFNLQVADPVPANAQMVAYLSDGTNVEFHGLTLESTGAINWQSRDGGVNVIGNSGAGVLVSAGQSITLAAAYATNDARIASGGVQTVTDANCTMPAIDRLWFGKDAFGVKAPGTLRAWALYAPASPATESQVAAASGIWTGAGRHLLIPKPITKTDWYTYNSIYAGARMVSADGAALCEVRNIADYDAGNVAVEVDWLSPVPAVPVTLYHATAGTLKVTGGNASSAWGKEDGTIRLRWTDRDPFWRGSAQDAFVLGTVRAVRVNVLRPATSTAAHKLWFRDVRLARNLFEVDLKTPGLREMTPNGIAGQAGADVFTAANWSFVETLRIEPRLGGGGGLPAAAPERARFAVEALIDTLA